MKRGEGGKTTTGKSLNMENYERGESLKGEKYVRRESLKRGRKLV